MALVLLALVLLPVVGAAVGHGPRATAAAFGLALVAGAAVLADGPFSAVLTDDGGQAVAGVQADHLAVVLLLLVLGVSVVVQAFAGRYLHGDAGAARFFAATGVLTTATAAMVSAASLVTFAAGWTVAGLALLRLLAVYPDLPAAQEGVRRTRRAFVVSDGALWVAVAVATLTWGTVDLRDLAATAGDRAGDTTALTFVACLLVVAAVGRSAQLPLQRWLPATLAAPTPVSALLHAGVVNAGGILLVRTSPIFGASTVATHIAFGAGAATAVYGTVLMLAKPDVKGALAHSTMGQMGFMVMTCGLGAYAAAVFHLVAHGMYKASLFLGSGAAVRRHVRHAQAPPVPAAPRPWAAHAAAAVVAPAAALGAATLLVHPREAGTSGTAALLLFAGATGVAVSWGWLGRRPGPRMLLVAGVLLGAAAFAYVLLVRGVTDLLAPSLTAARDASPSPWLLLLPAVAMAAVLAVIRLAPRRAPLLHRRLYVLALGAGDVGGRGHRTTARPAAGVVRLRPVLAAPASGRS